MVAVNSHQTDMPAIAQDEARGFCPGLSLDDTIVAISTAIGQGGIGIVRLSGPESLPIASRVFVPGHSSVASWLAGVQPNQLYFGHIADPANQRQIDEVLLAYMRSPRSYTRQDVVEIDAHGGVTALQGILSLVLAQGARMAHEGEFTLRAFLNGRIDLAQAEAVLDVISAKTDASLRVAVDQLGGRLSQQVRQLRGRLVDLLAYLQASTDFPEDDLPTEEIGPDLDGLEAELRLLLEHADRGIVYRQGIRIAIVGRPNVGKSSLLNALLRTDRAIVTPVPGTTRDTLEETLNVQGIPFVLVDTAGISESDDVIEQLGVERSRRSVQEADLVLMVVDGSERLQASDCQVADLVDGRAAILIINKCDLPTGLCHTKLLPAAPRVRVSALTGEGIGALESRLAESVLGGEVAASDEPVISSPRHRDLVRLALGHVLDAQAALSDDMPLDLLAIDMSEAVQSLGEITGETASEDLLASIFGRFCIGK